MTRFLEITERGILDSPDHNFFIIGYATLTLCKFTIQDPLITRVRSFLSEIALGNEHIAHRFSTIIGGLQEAYSRPPPTNLRPNGTDPEGDTELYTSMMDTLPEGYDSIGELLSDFFTADGELIHAVHTFPRCKSSSIARC